MNKVKYVINEICDLSYCIQLPYGSATSMVLPSFNFVLCICSLSC